MFLDPALNEWVLEPIPNDAPNTPTSPVTLDVIAELLRQLKSSVDDLWVRIDQLEVKIDNLPASAGDD